ncbi:MAG TPA: hypothetical protein VGK31_13180 [Thermoanaerobaculia bacterium]|jgi:hypothetical protein
MKTLIALLASFVFACASSQPAGRVALVLSKEFTQGHDLNAPIRNEIQGLLHATTVVNRTDDIDENEFDAVVVLNVTYSGLRDRSYDLATRRPTTDYLWPVTYEVRRRGIVAHRGSFALVIPDFRDDSARPYLEGVQRLLRDVAR